VRLEAAKTILDRHIADDHLAALLEVARKRRAVPVHLDDREIVDITPCQSDPK